MARSFFDVVIIGAGPAGLAATLQFLAQNRKVALIDPYPLLTKFSENYDLRVSALRSKSVEFFQKLGVFENMQALRVAPISGLRVFEENLPVDLPATLFQKETVGYIVEHQVLKLAMAQKCLGNSHLTIFETTLKDLRELDHGLTLHLENGQRLDTPLLIGADGADSLVRDLLGISLVEKNEGQHAIVANLILEHPHEYIAWQRFLPTGPVAILPLADPHHASLVWSYDSPSVENMLALSDEVFNHALTEALQFKLGKISVSSERIAFPLIQRLAKRFIAPYAALVGDAAHTVHPLAGLGLNLGLDDVEALGNLDLPRYERQQMLAAKTAQLSMTAYRALFSNSQTPLTWARTQALDFVRDRPILKRWLARKTIRL